MLPIGKGTRTQGDQAAINPQLEQPCRSLTPTPRKRVMAKKKKAKKKSK